MCLKPSHRYRAIPKMSPTNVYPYKNYNPGGNLASSWMCRLPRLLESSMGYRKVICNVKQVEDLWKTSSCLHQLSSFTFTMFNHLYDVLILVTSAQT